MAALTTAIHIMAQVLPLVQSKTPPSIGSRGAYQATRLRVLSGGLDVTPLLDQTLTLASPSPHPSPNSNPNPNQVTPLLVAASGVAALLSVPSTVALEATAAPGGGVARLMVRGVYPNPN
eukprot:scaffold55098_cov42-Phaeocystis_antarctica.AAC.2